MLSWLFTVGEASANPFQLRFTVWWRVGVVTMLELANAVRADACADVCTDMCMDMCELAKRGADRHARRHAPAQLLMLSSLLPATVMLMLFFCCMGVCTDMCINMCMDTRKGVGVDMCTEMCTRTGV